MSVATENPHLSAVGQALDSSLHRSKIMIVDDEPVNVKIVRKYLANAGYQQFLTVHEPREAIGTIQGQRPDLIMLDIMMPEISGLEILKRVRQDPKTAALPVIILTASTDKQTKEQALQLGATDFLSKPIDPSELVPRVRNALMAKAHYDDVAKYAKTLEVRVAERTSELQLARVEVVHCLGRAAEYRDNETGHHILRVGAYAGIIARQLGLPDAHVELLELASTLHDLGKIGIPDSILLKPGKLEPDEIEMMQRHAVLGKEILERFRGKDDTTAWRNHAELGAKIIGDAHSPLLKMAATIALTHHERWDGKGYPLALAGQDIPLESRITAVADVYDALSTKRPYKPAFPREKCFQIMHEERGRHFDPNVLDAFFARTEQIIDTQIKYAD